MLSLFHIIKDERLVSKMEGKTNFFRDAYSLSVTGIVECLEITDVGCNLKEFDGLT